MFNTISIEITSLCNRQCAWCPVAYNTRPDARMAEALLDKMVAELGRMRYAGRVELYIYNEPTRDWDWLLQAIAKVRAGVPRACIMIATNGDYFARGHAPADLFAAGLNQLLINCYTPKLYERRQRLLDALPPHVERGGPLYSYISPKRAAVQMQDKSNPSTFGTGVFKLVNRAGSIPSFLAAAPAPLQRMCVKPFRLLNINWQGEALVCCQDYHGKVPIGNVADHTLEELWRHPVMNTYRLHLFNKQRDLPLCNLCDCHAGAYPHNVEKPVGPYLKRIHHHDTE